MCDFNKSLSPDNNKITASLSMTCFRPNLAEREVSKESGHGFTLIGESAGGTNTEGMGKGIRVASALFDHLSEQSEIEHPLCEECTDNLLDMLDQQLRVAEDEGKDYQHFFDHINQQASEESLEAFDEELKKLQDEETSLRQQLASIEDERNHVREAIAQETDKARALDAEEEKYYHEYNEFKRQALEYEDAQRSAENQLRYAKAQLDKLKKTNVFNHTFHIWHSGHYGTINGFRLGRLPEDPVDWHEINAAWGQTTLLLYSLANKINLTFERYRLVPYGNHSYLECLTDKSRELPLYGSGGLKFFWDNKFDQAMVAFLDCLQQFKDAVERVDRGFSLPYNMDKGRIEDSSTGAAFSIKIQFNSEEQWTKALKFMLTNLKWGLAWIATHFSKP